MDGSRYLAAAPRYLEIVVGAVSTLLGVGLLALSGFVIYGTLGHPPPPVVVVVGCITSAVGLLLTSAGLRLVASKPRYDGGLLSPWVLRLGGFIFFSGPVIMLLTRQWDHILAAMFSLTAGVTCFVLANRREERKV